MVPRLLLVAFAVSTLLGTALAQEAATPGKTDWNSLIALYQELGLPLPPANAAPVLVPSGWSRSEGNKSVPLRSLGFILSEDKDGHPLTLLVGTEPDRPDRSRAVTRVAVPPGAKLAADCTPEWGKTVFEVNAGLAAAIQCKQRGWDSLAEALLAASLKESCGHHFSSFYQPEGAPPQLAIARVALAHWANELIRPDTDRAAIAGRLEALYQRFPELDTPSNRALLTSVRATAVARAAEPGSVAALVEDLTDYTYRPPSGDQEPDPRLRKIHILGFRAVPTLLNYLDDQRLTRNVRSGFNNFPTYHLRVGMVVTDLLQDIAGEEIGADWLDKQQGRGVKADAARAWWERARKQGEEVHMVRHVLPADPKDRFPNEVPLLIIQERYPWRIPAIYRTILRERQEIYSHQVTDAIMASRLTPTQKRTLLLEGARSTDLEHARYALFDLRKHDPQESDRLLIRVLERLPRTPRREYWISPEALIGHLVMLSEHPKVWDLFTRVARRSDVALRLEFINQTNSAYIGDRQRRERLQFLLAFMEDAALREHDHLDRGSRVALQFKPLSVRNLAAMKAGSIMGVGERPVPEWSEQQWAEYRATVQAALKQELSSPRR